MEIGFEEKAIQTIVKIADSQKDDGGIPAFRGANWICTVGLAQFAVILYKYGYDKTYKSKADKAIAFLEKNICQNGGFYGSVGVGSAYFPELQISWAAKFFIDAYLLKIQNFFDNDFISIAPDSISDDDNRLKAVLNEIKDGDKIIEVGCGKGRILKQLHERFANCDLTALDISRKLLDYLPIGIKKICSFTENIDLPDNNFDVVYAVESLEHSLNPRAAISEMTRICKPGGKLLVVDKEASQSGRLNTTSWETWYGDSEITGILQEHCINVVSYTLPDNDNEYYNGLFTAWKGIKKWL
jgi:malonyl-CoA O-methyltransferase